MEINEKLHQAGLTKNESKVYIELLTKGQLSANQTAKNIRMDRTLAYTVLNHLIEKGFVSYIIKENKKFFTITDKTNLLNPIKEKEILVRDLIRQLGKIEKVQETTYEINVYEGKEGLRSLLRLMMKYKSLCSFGATGRIYDYLYETMPLAKEFAKKKSFVRLITYSKNKKHMITKFKNVKIRYLNIKSEATTSIFGDHIAIHLIKNKPLIVLIKNKEISNSYQSYFNLLWRQAKK